MRPFQILCLLWGVFYSQADAGEAREIIDKADSALVEGTDQLFDAYRLQVATAVAKADRVELFRLKARGTETKAPGNPDDPFDDDAKNQWFKIAAPEASSARIQAKLEVPQEKLGPLIEKIADILEHPGDALAGCHDPAHGLRVYSGTELLFETSLCYRCRNFCLDSPIGGRWVPLPENGLKEMLMALLPLSEKTVLKTGLEFRLVVEEVSAETEMLPLKSKLKPESEEKLLTQRALEFSGGDIVSAKSIKTRATVVDEKGNEIKSTPISCPKKPEPG